jgi:hypothetical protein
VGVVVTFTLFFFQINVGVVPPFVGVDVKVTEVPEQMVVALAAIDTEGVTVVLTVIVTLFDVAFDVVTQVALLVISHVITSFCTKSDAL